MTQVEKLTLLVNDGSGVTPNPDLLELYLEQAKDIIQTYRYPGGDWPDELETRYEGLQVRIAEALYDKRGNEGQTAGSENGISRTYGTDGVPVSLLREITPLVTVMN